MDKELIKRLAKRFGRAFGAGAIAIMITIVPVMLYTTDTSWTDLKMWLGSLVLGGIIGGITGLVMAIDKYIRT